MWLNTKGNSYIFYLYFSTYIGMIVSVIITLIIFFLENLIHTKLIEFFKNGSCFLLLLFSLGHGLMMLKSNGNYRCCNHLSPRKNLVQILFATIESKDRFLFCYSLYLGTICIILAIALGTMSGGWKIVKQWVLKLLK